ncbi:Pullulanase 1, chloroplastic-like protein [Drosera capensis]
MPLTRMVLVTQLSSERMVQALNRIGLRVAMDVAYNHVHGSGPSDEFSVLDKVKIVRGYYLRRDADGNIENSTCCNNTANEHYMVERIIVDDLLNWAVKYKVRAASELCSLTKVPNGIDGSSIYLYCEGWDFGEVAKNGRGINASQLNLGGTCIGSFNDRIWDEVNGGSPFGDPLQQGFATGLALQPNGHDHGVQGNAERMLAISKDHIQERVHFHNTGPSSVPGVIVMSIEDSNAGKQGTCQLDPKYSLVVVVVNVQPAEVSLSIPALQSSSLLLHPVQVSSSDNIVKSSLYEPSTWGFTIPARTTAVFVEPRQT